MKKPYFYIIQEKSTGIYYAGIKYSKPDSSNFMTESGYKTTSKIIKKLIKENGLESFKTLKIKHFNTKDEVIDYEGRFLKKIKASTNPRFYNMTEGGPEFYNKGGYSLSEATKKRMSKPKSEQTKRKMSESFKKRPKEIYEKSTETRRNNGRQWVEENQRQKIIEHNKEYWTEDAKENHSELMKKYYKENEYKDSTREKISKKTKGKNNPMHGKKHSEETKLKMKKAWERRKKNK